MIDDTVRALRDTSIDKTYTYIITLSALIIPGATYIYITNPESIFREDIYRLILKAIIISFPMFFVYLWGLELSFKKLSPINYNIEDSKYNTKKELYDDIKNEVERRSKRKLYIASFMAIFSFFSGFILFHILKFIKIYILTWLVTLINYPVLTSLLASIWYILTLIHLNNLLIFVYLTQFTIVIITIKTLPRLR
ncbi:hypothetical protein BEH94_11965 [Candidatus Altiarchaeales archaeon WOR_SM1_SCG]|nr:hypothetical protein BEH94_11965 [Candidatus Altiarchaeales archaeon WOR_SM1_SCG]